MNLLHVLLACLCMFSFDLHTEIPSHIQTAHARRLAHLRATTRAAQSQASYAAPAINQTNALTDAAQAVLELFIGGRPTLRPTDSHDPHSMPSSGISITFDNSRMTLASRESVLTQPSPRVAQDFQNLNFETKQLLRKCTPEQVTDILHNNKNHLQMEATADRARNVDIDIEHAKFEEALITTVDLLPSPGFRQAIEKLPGFDRAMIILDKEMKADSTRKEMYQAISKHIFREDYSIFERMKSKPFDIVGYIQEHAQKAHDRMYKKHALEQQTLNKEAFSAEKLAVLTQGCSNAKNELAQYTSALKSPEEQKAYQDLVSVASDVESQLRETAQSSDVLYNHERTNNTFCRVTEDLYYNVGSKPGGGVTEYSYCTGNKAQITLYKAVDTLHDTTRALQVERIPEALNKDVAKNVVRMIDEQAKQAIIATKNGNLVVALEMIRSCKDLQLYAKSIVDGSFDYARHFSPEVLENLELEHARAFNGLIKKTSVDKLRGVSQRTGISVLRPLEHQDGIIHDALIRAKDLKDALREVRSGKHDILVKNYTVSEKAKKLCAERNICAEQLKRCVGNVYQQVRHAQAVALINQSADLYGRYPSSYLVSETAHTIIELSTLGGKALASGNVEQSMALDITAHALYDMTTILNNSAEHLKTINAATQGVVEGAAHLPQNLYDTAQMLYTNKEAIAQGIVTTVRNIRDALSVADEISTVSLRNLTVAEADAKILAKVEPLAQQLVQLAGQVQEITTQAVNKTIALSPEERARNLGNIAGDAIAFDGVFKALCSAAHLAKSGIRTLARVAPRVTAQTLERINATWAASTTALEKALADAELDMLGKLGIEAPFGQVAGTSLKAPIASDNPLVHFSDALIEKTGRDKVAAKTTEIAAKAEKAGTNVGSSKVFSLEKTSARGWNLSETGSMIEGRYYTKHALERMAPGTQETIQELEARAIARGYSRGSESFKKYVQPRGIPPSVVEDAIASVVPVIGDAPSTLEYISNNVKVVVNELGDVITVHRRSGK